MWCCIPQGLIREAQIDTRPTVLHLRGKLSSLDSYISSYISYDIVKFNEYVKYLMDSLTARGETTHDLLANFSRHTSQSKSKISPPTSKKWRMNMRKFKMLT